MKINSDHIPIGYHAVGRREPFIFVRRAVTRDYFYGESVARLRIRGQEICIPKDGIISIGSVRQLDDVYINDLAVCHGQVVIKPCERGLLVIDSRSGEYEIFSNATINIKLQSSPRPLKIEVLMGRPREEMVPAAEFRPAIRPVQVDNLLEQGKNDGAPVILKDYSQAVTAKQALAIHQQELSVILNQLIGKESVNDQYGDQSILAGLAFLTATSIGSLYDIIMLQLVSRFYFGLGVASTVMIVGGVAIKALNHHLTQSRFAYMRDRLQDQFVDKLRQFPNEEIARLIAEQEGPIREKLEKLVEVEFTTRSEQILMLAERLALALPPKRG